MNCRPLLENGTLLVYSSPMHRIRVIDSHTEGEPTRVIIEGGPDLGGGSLAERRTRFQQEFDRYRSAVVNEPRGSAVFVGALLVPPDDPSCVAGVIFFNNVGTLGMCGHGTIGVVVTLARLGRLQAGLHRIDTPAGVVTAELHESGDVSVRNVPSYRLAKDVAVDVDGYGRFRGDIAWGGDWFFLVNEHQESIALKNVERLTEVTGDGVRPECCGGITPLREARAASWQRKIEGLAPAFGPLRYQRQCSRAGNALR